MNSEPPTPDELAEWSERHCRLMGLSFTTDKQCVDEWTVEFVRFGYSAAELQSATTAMAALTQPVRLQGQLAWINQFIASLRYRTGRRDRREPDIEYGYDAAMFRGEIERLFPNQRWTAPNAGKSKHKKSKANERQAQQPKGV